MARPGGGILFPQRFHAGLRDGSVTRTIRAWSRLQVKVGGQYRLDSAGVLEVTGIEETVVGDLGPEDAARAGFASVEAVTEELRRVLKQVPAPDRTLFRVDLKYLALPDPRLTLAAADTFEEGEAEALADKLDHMDSRSRAPWTWVTLGLILALPEMSARILAPRLGRERLPFKTNVRKLKGLGLTESLEVGYRLSPRGEAVFAASEGDGT
jgi:hypothetical protein